MIVTDASVLIAHLEDGDTHHDDATRLLLDAAGLELGASPLTVAEVLVGPARAGRLAQAQAALDALDVRDIPLGPDAAARLATLRAQTGLKLPDCCVILAAADARAAAVASFDDRLAHEARRLGLTVLSRTR